MSAPFFQGGANVLSLVLGRGQWPGANVRGSNVLHSCCWHAARSAVAGRRLRAAAVVVAVTAAAIAAVADVAAALLLWYVSSAIN